MANPFINALVAGSQNKSLRLEREYLQKQRQREEQIDRIMAGIIDPGVTPEQVSAIPGTIRSPDYVAREPGINVANALAPLAKAGYGREALALSQAQRKQEMERQAATVEAMLKGAQYQKAMATAVSPIDVEREKSALRTGEMTKFLDFWQKNYGPKPPPPTAPPMGVPGKPAPTPEALDYFNANSNLPWIRDQFMQMYGFLPGGQ